MKTVSVELKVFINVFWLEENQYLITMTIKFLNLVRCREQRSQFCEYFWFLIQVSSSSPYHLLLQWCVKPKWDNHRPKNAEPIWKTALEASVHFYCAVPWLILAKINNNNFFFYFRRKIRYMSWHSPKANSLIFVGEYSWLSPESPTAVSVSSHSSVYFSSHGQAWIFTSPISPLYMPCVPFRMTFSTPQYFPTYSLPYKISIFVLMFIQCPLHSYLFFLSMAVLFPRLRNWSSPTWCP